MGQEKTADYVDVLIVGAGISGIGMAAHLRKFCPGKSFAMLERRDNPGGTWDLFRYPGIRSDSDMHTLGYNFKPWTQQKAIADGPSILKYLHETITEYDLQDHIRFGHEVLSASWSSAEACWTITARRTDGSEAQLKANFLFMGSGYYNYDEPHDPVFEGKEDFKGQIVHPQFWPKDLDYADKKVVVIGSGATAVTIVPSIADKAGHVTMLQRSPTYMFVSPAKDRMANFMRRILPDAWAYRFTRFKNVRLQNFMFKLARNKPEWMKRRLLKNIREKLTNESDMAHFKPRYNPWEQRLCLVPDNDFFEALAAGKASVVTDHIKRFDATGIALESGEHVGADIIVTATGLKLAVAGKVDFTVDGKPVNFHDHFYYKGCMFSNVPNMVIVFGYLNASWTLKADIVSEYTTRLLNHMDATGAKIANPYLANPAAMEEEDVFDFSSGYIQRSLDELPKSGAELPWRLNQDYLEDRKILRTGPLEDGVMHFGNAGELTPTGDNTRILEAAE
ncbi:NAD(P)/FAD-dependent oxidoreductase [Sphingorhabdus sp. Alg239-R122]|uniref:flavin-containing monooxygenase n=1 Tax=Sphingorhabdus sp. Alg239-R122 TaxID=2305989 RepID=UPI0013DC1538|nr:NAD(P)/FAD-dependent oxidoreductase [Sphingorhabdus sp. Alg239-R122]